MAAYRKVFNLNIQELELIEQALREQMGRHGATGEREPATAPHRNREIRALLGKLHQQKIFYSHSGNTHPPNG